MQTIQTDRIQASLPSPTFDLARPDAKVFSRPEKWHAYYELTKPGITKMVVLSASAGYYLAIPESAATYFSSPQHIFHAFLAVIGTTLVSSGSCALNHYIEKDVDRSMKRTSRRPIPSGKIVPAEALIFGTFLSTIGLLMLAFVNIPTLILAAVTLVTYIAVYTPLKRITSLSTLVGAVPGALPAMGGWVAVSGAVDVQAWVLFLILFFWQIPHFLALSWMYRDDYAAGGFPMLACTDTSGVMVARQIVLYIAFLLPVTLMMTVLHETGPVYFVGSLVACGIFLFHGVRFMRAVSAVHARKVLLSSYFFLMGVIILMFADKI